PALGQLLRSALAGLDPGLAQVLASGLQRIVISELPADAVELVPVGREHNQSGRDLVDAEVEVVRVGAAALTEPEHLAAEQLPVVEIGGGDPGIAHGPDVDRHERLLSTWLDR